MYNCKKKIYPSLVRPSCSSAWRTDNSIKSPSTVWILARMLELTASCMFIPDSAWLSLDDSSAWQHCSIRWQMYLRHKMKETISSKNTSHRKAIYTCTNPEQYPSKQTTYAGPESSLRWMQSFSNTGFWKTGKTNNPSSHDLNASRNDVMMFGK